MPVMGALFGRPWPLCILKSGHMLARTQAASVPPALTQGTKAYLRLTGYRNGRNSGSSEQFSFTNLMNS